MDIISLTAITIGAVLGVIMLINLMKGHHIPKALTIIHGVFVVTGVGSLIVYNVTHKENANWISILSFIGAAAMGIYILSRDIKHKSVPIPAIFIHGIFAVSGYVILLARVLSGRAA